MPSFINTKLRDGGGDLSDLCAEYGADEEELIIKLNRLGFYYDESNNCLKRK